MVGIACDIAIESAYTDIDSPYVIIFDGYDGAFKMPARDRMVGIEVGAYVGV